MFRATHVLLYQPQGNLNYNLDQLALLATSGDVPTRVAARLKIDRNKVRANVSAVAQADVSTLSIKAQSAQASEAVALADVTAEELANTIDAGQNATYQAELSRLAGQVEAARARLNGVKNPADQAAARNDLASAEQALHQYQSAGPPKSQLQTLEPAVAAPAPSAVAGLHAPSSKPVRAGLLGGFGVLIGVAIALTVNQLDSRIRSKASAEQAFGSPVIAEVPIIPKGSQGQLLARTQPSSAFVEAYRGLRTYVALWAPGKAQDDGHRVIVITSPSPSEGKTTTVAHLAAMLAEIGRSVVVISADLRRPRVHQYFDLAEGPGLTEALGATPGPPNFHGLDQATSVRGVRLLPSGVPVDNPAPLFQYAGELLSAARRLAEFVLVDAPPLLVANDAAELARHADGVLLVARAGKTPIEAAQRSAEVLERLEIPVVGSVLVASEAASSVSRYYASRYYSEPDRGGLFRRHSASENGYRPAAVKLPPASAAAPSSEQAPPTTVGS
jgi:capsular exopolysaccharide synthesis family protein